MVTNQDRVVYLPTGARGTILQGDETFVTGADGSLKKVAEQEYIVWDVGSILPQTLIPAMIVPVELPQQVAA